MAQSSFCLIFFLRSIKKQGKVKAELPIYTVGEGKHSCFCHR